ncbi:MAG: hypothetical protein JXK93_11570 [Sphaerochaetaceae bacterium]|nr:hypothetical protein [Sphaerochaetaceae bacterium]
MKLRRTLSLLICTCVVLFSSCELIESDVFQELKEVNIFKEFEDIPYYTQDELNEHLSPYGPVSDGVVTFPETNEDSTYRSVYTMRTAFNTSGSLVIESFTIVDDLTLYMDKIDTMVLHDTLSEFYLSGGSTEDLITNVTRIREKVSALKVQVNEVGFLTESIETEVNGRLDQIISHASSVLMSLQGGIL